MGSMRIYFSSFICWWTELSIFRFFLPLEHIHTPIAILGLNKTACEKINKVLVKKKYEIDYSPFFCVEILLTLSSTVMIYGVIIMQVFSDNFGYTYIQRHLKLIPFKIHMHINLPGLFTQCIHFHCWTKFIDLKLWISFLFFFVFMNYFL